MGKEINKKRGGIGGKSMMGKRKKENEIKRKRIENETREKMKRKIMEKSGWSGREWNRKLEEEQGEVEKEIVRELKELQIQEWRKALGKSNYAKSVK